MRKNRFGWVQRFVTTSACVENHYLRYGREVRLCGHDITPAYSNPYLEFFIFQSILPLYFPNTSNNKNIPQAYILSKYYRQIFEFLKIQSKEQVRLFEEERLFKLMGQTKLVGYQPSRNSFSYYNYMIPARNFKCGSKSSLCTHLTGHPAVGPDQHLQNPRKNSRAWRLIFINFLNMAFSQVNAKIRYHNTYKTHRKKKSIADFKILLFRHIVAEFYEFFERDKYDTHSYVWRAIFKRILFNEGLPESIAMSKTARRFEIKMVASAFPNHASHSFKTNLCRVMSKFIPNYLKKCYFIDFICNNRINSTLPTLSTSAPSDSSNNISFTAALVEKYSNLFQQIPERSQFLSHIPNKYFIKLVENWQLFIPGNEVEFYVDAQNDYLKRIEKPLNGSEYEFELLKGLFWLPNIQSRYSHHSLKLLNTLYNQNSIFFKYISAVLAYNSLNYVLTDWFEPLKGIEEYKQLFGNYDKYILSDRFNWISRNFTEYKYLFDLGAANIPYNDDEEFKLIIDEYRDIIKNTSSAFYNNNRVRIDCYHRGLTEYVDVLKQSKMKISAIEYFNAVAIVSVINLDRFASQDFYDIVPYLIECDERLLPFIQFREKSFNLFQ